MHEQLAFLLPVWLLGAPLVLAVGGLMMARRDFAQMGPADSIVLQRSDVAADPTTNPTGPTVRI